MNANEAIHVIIDKTTSEALFSSLLNKIKINNKVEKIMNKISNEDLINIIPSIGLNFN